MTTDQNPIDLIEARLDGGKRWWRGGDANSDNACLLTALWETGGFGSTLVERVLETVVVEQFPERITSERTVQRVAEFNDHPDTVFSDIEDVVLPKARQLYEDRLAGL